MDKARKEQLLQKGIVAKNKLEVKVSSGMNSVLLKPSQSGTEHRLNSILKIQKSQKTAETELHQIEKHFG
eukprot:579368-Hanusia_phi.AAC.2